VRAETTDGKYLANQKKINYSMQQTVIISKEKVPYLLSYVPTIDITDIRDYNEDQKEIVFNYDSHEISIVLIQFFFAGMMYKSDNK
jgi:hypothetical protein